MLAGTQVLAYMAMYGSARGSSNRGTLQCAIASTDLGLRVKSIISDSYYTATSGSVVI